jgi:hypothetical protein
MYFQSIDQSGLWRFAWSTIDGAFLALQARHADQMSATTGLNLPTLPLNAERAKPRGPGTKNLCHAPTPVPLGVVVMIPID